MRSVLVIAVLTASAGVAHAAEDRYGTPPVARPALTSAPAGAGGYAPTAAGPYAGRMLGWSGKAAPPLPPIPQAVPQVVPQPAVATAPVSRPGGVQSRLYPSMSRPMPSAGAPSVAAPLPTSLYDRPAPAQPLSAPQIQAAALPPSPSAPRPPAPVAAAQAGWSQPKYYSVHRQFGETPDPIPIPPPASYWVDRAGVTPQPATGADASGSATAPMDEFPGGVGADPDEDRPTERKVRTTNADGTVTTTTKRAAQ